VSSYISVPTRVVIILILHKNNDITKLRNLTQVTCIFQKMYESFKLHQLEKELLIYIL